MTKTTFKQCDVERAVRAAKAVGLVVSVVEVVTPDGTTIRICGKRDPATQSLGRGPAER